MLKYHILQPVRCYTELVSLSLKLTTQSVIFRKRSSVTDRRLIVLYFLFGFNSLEFTSLTFWGWIIIAGDYILSSTMANHLFNENLTNIHFACKMSYVAVAV